MCRDILVCGDHGVAEEMIMMNLMRVRVRMRIRVRVTVE